MIDRRSDTKSEGADMTKDEVEKKRKELEEEQEQIRLEIDGLEQDLHHVWKELEELKGS